MVRSHQPPPGWLTELLDGVKSADGMFVVDCDQTIVHWNESAEEMLGRESGEVVGLPCHEILAGRDSQNVRFCRRDCPVAQNARRGRPTPDYDIIAERPDDPDIWVNVSILVLKPAANSRPYVLHTFRDVTERRRVEALARRAMESLHSLEAEEAAGIARPVPLPTLSNRELQVLQLMACGQSTGDIAEELGLSRVTARNHITHIVSKLGAKNRLQAVVYASRRGLV